MPKSQIPNSPDTMEIVKKVSQLDSKTMPENVQKRFTQSPKPVASSSKSWNYKNIINVVLILLGIILSAYNVYQSYQINDSEKIHLVRKQPELTWVSISILVVFVILLCTTVMLK